MRWTPLVLVASARADERLIFAESLASRGLRVLHAADGAEALAVSELAAPDLVLLDLLLPEIDGLTLCERLKAPAAAAPRVVALTTMSYGGVMTQARAAGADVVLTKPCPAPRLVATVMEILGWPGGYRGDSGRWCSGSAQ